MKAATMKIHIIVKSNYGAFTIYPNCETAKIFAAIAGTKTLTFPTLKLIKALGYEVIEDVQPQLKGL